jgi:hypothetical protein
MANETLGGSCCVTQAHLVVDDTAAPLPDDDDSSGAAATLCHELAVRVAQLEAQLAATTQSEAASRATRLEVKLAAAAQQAIEDAELAAGLHAELTALRTETAQLRADQNLLLAQMPVGLPGSAFRASRTRAGSATSTGSSTGGGACDRSSPVICGGRRGGGSGGGGRPASAGARFTSTFSASSSASGANLCPVCAAQMPAGCMAQHFIACARDKRNNNKPTK